MSALCVRASAMCVCLPCPCVCRADWLHSFSRACLPCAGTNGELSLQLRLLLSDFQTQMLASSATASVMVLMNDPAAAAAAPSAVAASPASAPSAAAASAPSAAAAALAPAGSIVVHNPPLAAQAGRPTLHAAKPPRRNSCSKCQVATHTAASRDCPHYTGRGKKKGAASAAASSSSSAATAPERTDC
jgi:hypothetical protein